MDSPAVQHRKARRIGSLAAACAVTMATALAGLAPPAAADPVRHADAPTDPIRTAALDWIEAELGDGGHGMAGFSPGTFDWGLTADALLALGAGGRSGDPEALATTANLLSHTSEYATWDDLGPDYPGVRTAGALAKLALVAEVQGIDDPAATDGFDLQAELRSTMVATGAQTGRFSDIDPHFSSDNSNGFGQALAILALSYTDLGVPSAAVDFLLAQQCPGGGFRLTYGSTAGCSTARASDSDASAMAIQALLVVDRSPEVHAALVEGLDHLEATQDPIGGWGGTGPTIGLNTNSTGLISQTLRAAGRAGSASAGGSWVAGAALTPANTGTGPASTEVGAIAYNYDVRNDALANGIGARDQWRRATTQAVLALDLPDFGSIGRAAAPTVDDLRTPTESFVAAAYEDFLDRAPTAAESALAVAQVQAEGKRRFLATLSTSDAWIATIVERFYLETLGRAPDAAGYQYWTNQIGTGRHTVADAAAEFYASAEYFTGLGGNATSTWVGDLYEKLLHRSVDPGGQRYWVQRTDAKGRGWVAEQIFGSLESRRDRVTGLYLDLLGRTPDAGGRDYWAERVATRGDIALAVDLAGSAEYGARSIVRFP